MGFALFRKTYQHRVFALAALFLFGAVQPGPAADATSNTFQKPSKIEVSVLDELD